MKRKPNHVGYPALDPRSGVPDEHSLLEDRSESGSLEGMGKFRLIPANDDGNTT